MLFVVYPKEHERRLRAKRELFALTTRESGHAWHSFDFTPVFPEWMAASDYRDFYFDSPDDLSLKLESEFVEHAADRLRAALTPPAVDASSVVGVFGAGALYGFGRLSRILHAVERDARAVGLVVFFPATTRTAITGCSTHATAETTWRFRSPCLKEGLNFEDRELFRRDPGEPAGQQWPGPYRGQGERRRENCAA